LCSRSLPSLRWHLFTIPGRQESLQVCEGPDLPPPFSAQPCAEGHAERLFLC
jgi:hypothetical protein